MKKIVLLLLLLLVISSLGAAHEGEEDTSTQDLENARGEVLNRRATNDWSGFSPIFHFREGNWFAGTFIIVFILLAIKGFIDLIMLVVARALHEEK